MVGATRQFAGPRDSVIDGLLSPRAVSVVGASPNGQITGHLLHNLENRSLPFSGEVYLVNPRYSRIFDRRCYPAVSDIPGPPGLLYLMVQGRDCRAILDSLTAKPDGVILYPEVSRDPGGYESEVSAWAIVNDVPILGPQSTGLVSTGAHLIGLLAPIVENVAAGGVALASQSGGVLAGMVKFLAQRGIGIHSAFAVGTGLTLPLERVARSLLDRDDVRLVAFYADGISSLTDLAAACEYAQVRDKPVVLMVGGLSEAGRRAANSHSGMASTPRKRLAGIAEQYGAILVDTLDALVWSVDALNAINFERPQSSEILLFTDSGGGGIAMADAFSTHGVELREPSAEFRARHFIGSASLNPFDFGAASLGELTGQAEQIQELGSDPQYGVCAYASTQGMAIEEQGVQIREIDQFAATVRRLGKWPFIASTFPFQRTALVDSGPQPGVIGLGSIESTVKLQAISAWSRPAPTEPYREQRALAGARSSDAADGHEHPSKDDDPSRVLAGPAAETRLASLPVRWPRRVSISSISELKRTADLSFPLVVKTDAPLAHRAVAGGVLTSIKNAQDLHNAAVFMLQHFDSPVSICESVHHDAEYFLGAIREGGDVFLLLGAGGRDAESSSVRLAPLSASQAASIAASVTSTHVEQLTAALLALQAWVLATDDVEAVDLNPIVPVGVDLIVLDAKLHITVASQV